MNQQSTAVAPLEIEALVGRRPLGFSLEAPFYTSPEIFDLDVEAIFAKHWIFCAVEPEIPEPGDYVTVDIGPYSVIVVRDDDEEVRAFHNVCRHRGFRILGDACGSVGNIVCPYHQWTYRVDGELIFAESQPSTFDKQQFGLRPAHARSIGGLIFVCLAEEAPEDFDELTSYLTPWLEPYDLAHAKVAHQTDLEEQGNWKLVMENNRECYHCDACHPELITAYFPFAGYTGDDVPPKLRPVWDRFQGAIADLERACAERNFPRDIRRELDTRPTGFHVQHDPLDGEGKSFGADGAAVCTKLLGSITEPRFGDLNLHMQPNSWFHFLSDHAVVFRVLPVSPDRSVVRSTWLVHPDAVEGVDYDLDELTMVWNATNAQDSVLVAGTQAGVGNPGYVPGPYSLVEGNVEAFVNWYVGRVRAHLGG